MGMVGGAEFERDERTAHDLFVIPWAPEARMSQVNGEKARAAIAKRNRTARRAKDRARLAELKNTTAKKHKSQEE